MLDLERARLWSFALLEVGGFFVSHLGGLAVAGITEMGIAPRNEGWSGLPAEPECDAAAVLALELDVVLAVLVAVGVEGDGAALGADEFGLVELPSLVVDVELARLESSEVGLLALVALVVGVDGHGVVDGLGEVRVVGVFELLVLVPALVLEPVEGLVLDGLVQLGVEAHQVLEGLVVGRGIHPLLAEGAHAVVERDPGPVPPGLDPLGQALDVEHLGIEWWQYTCPHLILMQGAARNPSVKQMLQ